MKIRACSLSWWHGHEYKCDHQGTHYMSVWTVGIDRCDIWGDVRWR